MNDQLKPTDVLACFFAKVADMVGSGDMGNASRAVLYIRGEHVKGQETPAIVITYPVQTDDETIAELEQALMWMRTPIDSPAASGVPS